MKCPIILSTQIIAIRANPDSVIGRGTDSAIYNVAGADEFLQEGRKIGSITREEAIAAPAFNLNQDLLFNRFRQICNLITF